MSHGGSSWTVLLYLGWAGNAEFEERQDAVLDTIAKTTGVKHAELVYQFARHARVERGRIRRGQREILSTTPPIDIIDPRHVTRFLDWAGDTFPSRYTALFVKDHGQGPIDGAKKHSVLTASGIFENGQHRYMPMPLFRRAIERSTARLDVLGLDACRLGSVEVAYELRDLASYLVVSEMTVPTTGWAYAEAIDHLDHARDATPRDLARTIVEASKTFRIVPLELAWIPQLAECLDALGTTLLRHRTKLVDWVRRVFPNALTDGVGIERLVMLLEGEGLCDLAILVAIKEAIERARLLTSTKPAGIGVYFPTTRGSASIASYGSAEFARDTSWAEFAGTLNHWLMT